MSSRSQAARSAVHRKGREMQFWYDHCKIDCLTELVFAAGAWCQGSSHRTPETLLRCKKTPSPLISKMGRLNLSWVQGKMNHFPKPLLSLFSALSTQNTNKRFWISLIPVSSTYFWFAAVAPYPILILWHGNPKHLSFHMFGNLLWNIQQ